MRCHHPPGDLYLNVGLPSTHSAFTCPRCGFVLSIHSNRLQPLEEPPVVNPVVPTHSLSEQALHAAAIAYARDQIQPLEDLVGQIRSAVREAQGNFSSHERTMREALIAFNQIVVLVGGCTRMAGDPPCARDGTCPEHGRHRPGPCVPEIGVGSSGETG